MTECWRHTREHHPLWLSGLCLKSHHLPGPVPGPRQSERVQRLRNGRGEYQGTRGKCRLCHKRMRLNGLGTFTYPPASPVWGAGECACAGIVHLLHDIRILETSEVASTCLQGAQAERQGGSIRLKPQRTAPAALCHLPRLSLMSGKRSLHLAWDSPLNSEPTTFYHCLCS